LRSRYHKHLIHPVFFALLFSSFSLYLQAGSLETIQTKVAQFLKRPGARSADWGIEILDPTTDKVVLSVNPDKPFTPASVLKVTTTSAALERLGPDFKFRTGAYAEGTIQADGVLLGNLILVGRGDPNLTDPYGELLQEPALQELAEKLQALGIKKVQGDIIGDDSYFDPTSTGRGWTAQELKSIYGAPINALSINNNIFWIHAHATKQGKAVSVSIEPATSYFRIKNTAITGSSKSKETLRAGYAPGSKTITVSGILPLKKSSSHSILLDKPAEVTVTMFKEELKRRGIAVAGKVKVIHNGDLSAEVKSGWHLLAEHESVPLYRTLEIINKHSQNLHAEMLLRTLGAEFKHQGTDEAGLDVVWDYLVQAGVEGMDSKKIQLNDGCGLSRDNLLTPRFQASLLKFLSTRPYFDLFLNTLAVSGTDGTLKNRLASEQVRGTIHAKTGTLNGVSTLSGYMTTKSGHNLVFCIFANNVRASMTTVKKTIDEICSLFVNLY
jgi:serine-type D-Ala-D-Ala carboxypeptidase/endopeptidase (penicillin-binding protein 4)